VTLWLGRKGNELPHAKILELFENFLSENFRPQMQNFTPKTPIMKKLNSKVEIMSTDNIMYRKFAPVCRNSVGQDNVHKTRSLFNAFR